MRKATGALTQHLWGELSPAKEREWHAVKIMGPVEKPRARMLCGDQQEMGKEERDFPVRLAFGESSQWGIASWRTL